MYTGRKRFFLDRLLGYPNSRTSTESKERSHENIKQGLQLGDTFGFIQPTDCSKCGIAVSRPQDAPTAHSSSKAHRYRSRPRQNALLASNALERHPPPTHPRSCHHLRNSATMDQSTSSNNLLSPPELSPLEQEVLEEYERLAENMKRVSEHPPWFRTKTRANM